ncbi:MAG TPA: FlgD immunoglobulin-like domain containing protein, partial [Candidatus Cloacimonadota bacterium]|nr:FlgD immunoglobulin-like domain containing protein [Candidatus Cloacimonadota bacterium]
SFYGVNYQSMSVCSNGFITFTNSQNGDFRNWHLPGALGPNAMVAAFWDDLILLTGAGVYRYYDSVQHRFIIEWYQTKNGYDRTSEETFEVILYDPAYYPTSNGDGQIKIQYKVFNNVDTGGGGSPRQGDYCTIGIKDHTGLVGLEYSFNNQYPAAAAPLSNNNALLITGIPIVQEAPHILLGELVLQDQNMNQIAEPGETVDFGIRLSNMGNTIATNVHASISSVDEYVTILNSSSLYDPIAGQNSGINKTYFRILISPACPDHHIITLTVFITAQGYSWQRYASIQVTKPQLSFGNTYINDINGNNNGMADPGESFKIIMNISNPGTVDDKDATITVSTTDQSLIISNPTIQIGRIPAGQTKQAVVNMSLAQNAVIGNFVTIHYQLSGDNANPINGVYSLGIHTTGVYNDFEATNGGFISQSGWMWGTSNQTSGHSGRNMWGTSLNAEYPANANFILTTPLLMIGSNAQLSFWHKYGCESTYDGGNVSISTDGGTTYNLLTPDGGYPALSVSSLQEPCFSGTLSSWVLVNFDLSQYGNQQIKIRWHFCSDSMVNGIGWFIDDVSISGFTNPTGIIQGNLQFAEENPQYTHALIHANNIAVQPDTTGYYQIFLQNGTYNISVDMPSYQTLSSQAVILNATNQTQIVNFNMNYLPPVPHLWYQVSNHHLTMSWDDLEPSANQFQHFSILRRIDADRYLLIGQTTSTNYSEDLTSEGEYSYFVTVDYLQGTSIPSDSITFQSDATGNSDQNVIPAKTVLFANYPNPFNPETHISFALSHDSRVKLEIFNIRGQLVKTLTDEPYTAGTYSVNWNGTDKNNHSVASGMYFYRLSLPGYSSTRKALLLK